LGADDLVAAQDQAKKEGEMSVIPRPIRGELFTAILTIILAQI
jgi:hypothetical protein